jgi:hypothetical protein
MRAAKINHDQLLIANRASPIANAQINLQSQSAIANLQSPTCNRQSAI